MHFNANELLNVASSYMNGWILAGFPPPHKSIKWFTKFGVLTTDKPHPV